MSGHLTVLPPPAVAPARAPYPPAPFPQSGGKGSLERSILLLSKLLSPNLGERPGEGARVGRGTAGARMG